MADAVAEKKPEAAPGKPAPRPRFTARLRYARISARKMRYVVDLIRGKDYNSAIAILRSCPKRGAMFCKKLLESAFGNAADIINTRELDIDVNRLHVIEARVDPGPIIKRWRPSSVRRPNMIKKRLCHVIFSLEERDLKETRRDRAKRQKQERQRQKSQAAAPAGTPPGAPAAEKPAPKAEKAAPKAEMPAPKKDREEKE